MRILQVNKYYYPKGGAETYFLSLIDLLKNKGQEVLIFSQRNKKNLPSAESRYFLSDLNLEKLGFKNIFRIGRIFWSFAAARKIKNLILDQKPDLVHIHNIYHQISPSILPAIKKTGVPIVMTVHDFKLIKPDYTLWATSKKIRHKNSWLADILVKLEFHWHKKLGVYKKNIDAFIAPSDFVKNQLVKNGFAQNKIFVLPHFIEPLNSPAAASNNADQNYLLFFGRLDKSKGADTLIRAFKNIPAANLKLKIVGLGPQENYLKQLVKKLGLEEKIEFLGAQNKETLAQTISQSLFAIFPSRVAETFGLGVLETFAQGKPVIATRVGALPELVKHNQNGILVKVDDQIQLAQAIEYLINKPDNIIRQGENAKTFAQNFNSESHYQKLMGIYQKILAGKK